MSTMFSQDFFLAIILQDSSPGEGQPRCDVGVQLAGKAGYMSWVPGMEWCDSAGKGGLCVVCAHDRFVSYLCMTEVKV